MDPAAPYDEILDRLLSGDPVDLEAWLQAHPDVRPTERLRLIRMAGILGVTVPDVETPADGGPALESIGGYKILQQLGSGGMGVVFLAEQQALGRQVAIKVLHPGLSAADEARERFVREAQAVAKLQHPHIVTIYDVGSDSGVPYIVMEYIEGQGLDELIRGASSRGRTLPVNQVLVWGREIAEALDAAHGRGIVHRDLKPSNIRIDRRGSALLLDFGLAFDASSHTLTVKGGYRGTPSYSSPEQVAAGHLPIGPTSDIYSLGVSLYQALTGQVPFLGETQEQVFGQILTKEALSPRKINPAVSRDLQVVLGKAMEKDPTHRYASARLFAEDLRRVVHHEPVLARPPGSFRRVLRASRKHPRISVAAAVMLMAGLAIGGTVIVQERSKSAAFGEHMKAAAALRTREDFDGALAAYDRALGVRPRDIDAVEARLSTLDARERTTADKALNHATDLIQRYAEVHDRVEQLARDLPVQRKARFVRHMSPEESLRLQEWEREHRQAQAVSQRMLMDVLEAIRVAQEHVPDHPRSRELTALVFFRHWKAALAAGDPVLTRLYADLVRRFDDGNKHASDLAGLGRLNLGSNTRARAWIFRYREEDEGEANDELRRVPIPFKGPHQDIVPGSAALVVLEHGKTLDAGDLILEVSGHPIGGTVFVLESRSEKVARGDVLVAVHGEPVKSLHEALIAGSPTYCKNAGGGGIVPPLTGPRRFQFQGTAGEITLEGTELAELVTLGMAHDLVALGDTKVKVFREDRVSIESLSEGLATRPTLAPLPLGSLSALGETPLRDVSLQPGSYLLVLVAEGRAFVRLPMVMPREGTLSLNVDLPPLGEAPAGFVLVSGKPSIKSFWMQAREVTAREYLEFLNDPETLSEIAASQELIRVPRLRHEVTNERILYRCSRAQVGFEIAKDELRLPIWGVSAEDASAFAAWKTKKARASGLDLTFELPRRSEWIWAAQGADERTFPFGNYFVPGWVSSRLAHKVSRPESPFSYPRDESPFGVYDLCGGQTEWCADQPSGVRTRHLQGGAWAFLSSDQAFAIEQTKGMPALSTMNQTGIRLIARTPSVNR